MDEWIIAQGWLIHDKTDLLRDDRPADYERRIINAAQAIAQLHGGTIDWVICGGESGPGARPMHPDWARSLRDQCQAAGVPFFFKQWGEWQFVEPTGAPDDGGDFVRVGKKKSGRLLDGHEWNEYPA